jgi:hypothetical protein
MGPEIGFSTAFAAAHPIDTLVLMPGADGGTGFSDMRWRVGDDLYLDAVARLNALFAANPSFVFGGFLWHQGEKDTGQTPAFYQTHLDAMIEGLRTDVTAAGPTTPFVLGQMVESYYVGTAGREAIQAVTDDTPNRLAHTAVASSAGLVDKGDALHFDGPSQRTLGARYHAAALLAVTNAPGAPAQVTGLSAVAGDGQVSVSWSAPSNGGSAITDYVVERQIGGGAFSVVADGVGTGTTFVDTGRTNDVVHGYRISAVNAVGTGAVSAVASATPGAADVAPAQVTGLSAVAGDGQVSLSWSAPSNGGSAITDYVVERRIGGGEFVVVTDGVGTGTTFVDTGRTNDVVHGYRISAVNAVGTGAASAVASATPVAAVQLAVAVNTFSYANDPGSASTYTFAGMEIGTGSVFVGVTRRGGSTADVTISALTIGGVAATQIGEQQHISQTGQSHSMHRLDGVSAGTADVVLTIASNAARCGIVVWTLDNAGTAVFAGGALVGSPNITVTADAPEDGVLLAHGMCIASPPGISFTAGVDQRLAEREVDTGYFDQAGDRAYATAQAGVSVTQTGTAGTNTILTVLAVSPA